MSRVVAKTLWAMCLLCRGISPELFIGRTRETGTAPQAPPYKFQSKVNGVLVPVVVLDQQGHAVGNLTENNFRIFDEGKPQLITAFSTERRNAEYVETRLPPGTGASGTMQRPNPVVPISRRFIAFLFDDVHLSSQELVHVRAAGARMLGESLNGADRAAVLSTSGRTNTGFTANRASLQDAIANLRPAPIYSGARNECPDVDHYAAYMILKMSDQETLDAVVAQGCSPDKKMEEGMARAAAAWEFAAGEQGTHRTLEVIKLVIRQMRNLPGQRTLVLISPGFIALTPEASRDRALVTDAAAEASVTVSTLDARGLDPRMMDIGKMRDSAAEGSVRRDSGIAYGTIMSELASGTGGTYFHDTNDLEAGFERLTKAPECLYLLEFSPKNVKRDGAYHPLRVKVNVKGMKVRARTGYIAEEPVKANQTEQGR